jgi:hypothetical protein
MHYCHAATELAYLVERTAATPFFDISVGLARLAVQTLVTTQNRPLSY